jgi:hypothetical protein
MTRRCFTWLLTQSCAVLACIAAGCGKESPQFTSPEHQQLLKRVEAAVEQRRQGLFFGLGGELDNLYRNERLDDAQYHAVLKIVQLGKNEEWEKAEQEIKALIAAQKK